MAISQRGKKKARLSTPAPFEVDSERVISAKILETLDEGRRLDVWLSDRFTYQSRHQWQKLIHDGQILVNDCKCRPASKLKLGDNVTFKPQIVEPECDLSYKIVYEDDEILVVDKSGRLPCHPGGPFFKNTLWYLLRHEYGEIAIINRLDRETSGLTLVVKNRENASAFSKLFSSRQVTKKYLALVHGQFPDSIKADGVLINDKKSEINKKRCFVSETESRSLELEMETASTDFNLEKSYETFSLVAAWPKTGRLHQIRATLFSLGFPLVGDKLYGLDDSFYLKFAQDKMSLEDWDKLILRRQALHASFLSFFHPFQERKLEFEAPLPYDMQTVL